MARMAAPDPFASMRRNMPRTGPPVQNMGGFAINTAPMANRPPSPPGARIGPPGPPKGTMPQTATGLGPYGGAIPQAQPTGGLNSTAGLPPGAKNFGPGGPAPGGGLPVPVPGGKIPTAPGGPATTSTGAPPVPPAPAPAPGAPAPAPVASSDPNALYGRGGGTGDEEGSLGQTLRNYINRAMGGVTSQAFIDRARNQLGTAVEGQRASAVNRINDDAIRRGMFRSGIPSEQAAAAGTASQGAFATGLQNILQSAEQQDIAGRESAANQAGNLLGMNRQWDQYTQQRMDAERARRDANQPRMFQYMDPDTGQVYEMDESWF